MIKANELRIGNWVLFIKKITQVESWMFIQGVKHITPIPLTPEILEKCGFKADENYDFYFDMQTHGLEIRCMTDGFYPTYIQHPEMSCDMRQSVSLERINYVHELQNLFFVLHKEELEIAF